MTRNMVMELSYGLQATCMLANIGKMRGMGKEKWHGQMDQSTLEIGSEAYSMEKERWYFPMVLRNVAFLRIISTEVRSHLLYGLTGLLSSSRKDKRKIKKSPKESEKLESVSTPPTLR